MKLSLIKSSFLIGAFVTGLSHFAIAHTPMVLEDATKCRETCVKLHQGKYIDETLNCVHGTGHLSCDCNGLMQGFGNDYTDCYSYCMGDTRGQKHGRSHEGTQPQHPKRKHRKTHE